MSAGGLALLLWVALTAPLYLAQFLLKGVARLLRDWWRAARR